MHKSNFSSAFNTIHPLILADRLKEQVCLDSKLITWIWDFLYGQIAKGKEKMSEMFYL